MLKTNKQKTKNQFSLLTDLGSCSKRKLSRPTFKHTGAIPVVRAKARKPLIGQKVRPYRSKKVRILTYPELGQNQLSVKDLSLLQ